MQFTHSLKRRIVYILLGVAGTLLVTLVILNLLPQEKQIAHDLQQVSAVDSRQFRNEVSSMLGPTVLDGNSVQDFQNGGEYFPAMLEAIRHARRSIDLETYIYWSGEVSERFVKALSERARAGIPVHVLVDWIGASKMDEDVIARLREAGVKFRYFHPLSWYSLDRLNNRTHRKLLIVDGRVGLTGGAGIADAWDGNAQRPDHWRDMEFRVAGPVASQMQAVFEDNWITTTGEVLLGTDYYPRQTPEGNTAMQMFSSSPEGGSENLQLMYLMAIHGARHSIDLEAAYFIPDKLTRKALREAMARGVKLRIVVPGPHHDASYTHDASREAWGGMLEAGATIYRYQPSLFHNKMMIVDHYLTMVGSANFDNRSFKLNDEANLNIYDRDFAEHMTDIVDADIVRSKPTSLSQWQKRPWTRKFKDWMWSLTDSQL